MVASASHRWDAFDRLAAEFRPLKTVGTVLRYTERAGATTFRVRVVPRASRSDVVGEHDGALRVRVAAPPVEGAANEELVRTIARALGVPARDVEIISGHSSKVKQVRVRGVEREALERLAREK